MNLSQEFEQEPLMSQLVSRYIDPELPKSISELNFGIGLWTMRSLALWCSVLYIVAEFG